jgi:ferredoxin
MKAIVNDMCAGSGHCAELCPEVFEMASDGLAKVKVDVVPTESEDACRQAALECPVQAIYVEEGE